jgi:hypothetical protein
MSYRYKSPTEQAFRLFELNAQIKELEQERRDIRSWLAEEHKENSVVQRDGRVLQLIRAHTGDIDVVERLVLWGPIVAADPEKPQDLLSPAEQGCMSGTP